MDTSLEKLENNSSTQELQSEICRLRSELKRAREETKALRESLESEGVEKEYKTLDLDYYIRLLGGKVEPKVDSASIYTREL